VVEELPEVKGVKVEEWEGVMVTDFERVCVKVSRTEEEGERVTVRKPECDRVGLELLEWQGLGECVPETEGVSLALEEARTERLPEGDVEGEGERVEEGHSEPLCEWVAQAVVETLDEKDTVLVRQRVGEEERLELRVLLPLELRERDWEPHSVMVERALAVLVPL